MFSAAFLLFVVGKRLDGVSNKIAIGPTAHQVARQMDLFRAARHVRPSRDLRSAAGAMIARPADAARARLR